MFTRTKTIAAAAIFATTTLASTLPAYAADRFATLDAIPTGAVAALDSAEMEKVEGKKFTTKQFLMLMMFSMTTPMNNTYNAFAASSQKITAPASLFVYDYLSKNSNLKFSDNPNAVSQTISRAASNPHLTSSDRAVLGRMNRSILNIHMKQ